MNNFLRMCGRGLLGALRWLGPLGAIVVVFGGTYFINPLLARDLTRWTIHQLTGLLAMVLGEAGNAIVQTNLGPLLLLVAVAVFVFRLLTKPFRRAAKKKS